MTMKATGEKKNVIKANNWSLVLEQFLKISKDIALMQTQKNTKTVN